MPPCFANSLEFARSRSQPVQCSLCGTKRDSPRQATIGVWQKLCFSHKALVNELGPTQSVGQSVSRSPIVGIILQVSPEGRPAMALGGRPGASAGPHRGLPQEPIGSFQTPSPANRNSLCDWPKRLFRGTPEQHLQLAAPLRPTSALAPVPPRLGQPGAPYGSLSVLFLDVANVRAPSGSSSAPFNGFLTTLSGYARETPPPPGRASADAPGHSLRPEFLEALLGAAETRGLPEGIEASRRSSDVLEVCRA